MPLTIPYDPSFVLGNIVPKDKLDNLLAIAAAQKPVDDAEANLNSLISLKRSIDLTIIELGEMNVDVNELQTQSKQLGKDLSKVAQEYVDAKVKFADQISGKNTKTKLTTSSKVNAEVESPIDYTRSILKKMPISSDSLKMNVQYFSFDGNSQDASTQAAKISTYVSQSFSKLCGPNEAGDLRASAAAQINSQYENRSILGTLVISINCTHKNAQIFAPLVLDPDKAVTTWNKLGLSTIDTSNPGKVKELEKNVTNKNESFNILSGATYGSAFVGMVHILNTTETLSTQELESMADAIQETMDAGCVIEQLKGGFGASSSFSNSAKKLLSQNHILSHCSAITMGIIPSIKSNQVQVGLKSFAKFDPDQEMTNLAKLQNATANNNNSLASAAKAARTGEQMIELQNSKISSALSSLAAIDKDSNNIIDVNSLMTAMDDYIEKCVSGGDNIGVPVNYFLKPITQDVIARSWMEKYFPPKMISNPGKSDPGAPGKSDPGAPGKSDPGAPGKSDPGAPEK